MHAWLLGRRSGQMSGQSIATRIATRIGCPKSSAVSGLYGRLSIALVRTNARALLARSPSYL